jgi:hypothetical protein
MFTKQGICTLFPSSSIVNVFLKSIIASSKSILIPLSCSYELEAIDPPLELPSNFSCAPDAEPIVALPSSVKLKH